MPMATSPLPWFAHPRGIYQMPAPEELAKQNDKMPVTTVLSHSPSTVSPSSLTYPTHRFVRMDAERIEHHSPVPRLLTPEDHRDDSTASRSPPASHEDVTPLDFSRPATNAAAAAKEVSHSPSYGGVVDLCTRGSAKEISEVKSEEEERHNISRGSSSDGSGMYNTSAVGPFPSGNSFSRHQPYPHAMVQPLPAVVQQYPLHPVALHPHHQHFIMAATPQQHSPQMGVPEGTAVNSVPGGPQPPNFQGILSLTPPPPLPLHAPITATVPHPLPLHQQPPSPPMIPAPLHQTLAAATSCKSDSGSKMTRPFKAYPKDPLTLTVGVSTAESFLGQASNEAYVEFRKQMLKQVAAAKARRPTTGQQSEEQVSSGESPESAQLQQQQSSSSGDEDGTPGTSKKRSRTNSESNSPYSVVKDAAYWERRRKNNEAAKRSRDARRAKEDEIAIRAAFLEQENLKLKYEVAALRHETSNLRCLLYSAANNS